MASSASVIIPHLRSTLRGNIRLPRVRTLTTSTTMAQEHKNLPQATFFPAMKQTMLPKETYKGKVVFISGGGTGLGKGMATKFSDLGATVVIASRRLNVLEDAAKGNRTSKLVSYLVISLPVFSHIFYFVSIK